MAFEELDFSSRLTDRCGSANSFSDENLREIDFYGNNALHQCFACNGNIVDSEESIKKIKKVLRIFPNSAFMTNQFGRLPIHYALDRIRVSTNALDILYEHFNTPNILYYQEAAIRYLINDPVENLNRQFLSKKNQIIK